MDRTSNHWMILLKFSQREYLEQFRTNGLVYLNTQTYFSKMEKDSVRFDRFEGADRILQPSALRNISIKNNVSGAVINIPPRNLAGPVLVGLGGPACNIYCMFAIQIPVNGKLVDERNFPFGDSFILVLNTQKFLDRFDAAVKQAGFQYMCQFVEYYDVETYHGEAGPFRKPSLYAHQNEFRFVVRPGSNGPIQFSIGSLVDITSPVLPLAEVNRLVDFSEEDAKNVGLI